MALTHKALRRLNEDTDLAEFFRESREAAVEELLRRDRSPDTESAVDQVRTLRAIDDVQKRLARRLREEERKAEKAKPQ